MLTIIVAADTNSVIGKDGGIPWKMQADHQRFERLIAGHKLIMGRATLESHIRQLGRPRPRSIVVSTSLPPSGDYTVVRSLADAVRLTSANEETFILGGTAIFKGLLPLTGKMYFTHVKTEGEGDAYFPSFNDKEWEVVKRESHEANADNPFPYDFIDVIRTSH